MQLFGSGVTALIMTTTVSFLSHENYNEDKTTTSIAHLKFYRILSWVSCKDNII